MELPCQIVLDGIYIHISLNPGLFVNGYVHTWPQGLSSEIAEFFLVDESRDFLIFSISGLPRMNGQTQEDFMLMLISNVILVIQCKVLNEEIPFD